MDYVDICVSFKKGEYDKLVNACEYTMINRTALIRSCLIKAWEKNKSDYKQDEITMRFSITKEKLGKMYKSHTVRVPAKLMEEINKIVEITDFPQSSFIKYLMMPEIDKINKEYEEVKSEKK